MPAEESLQALQREVQRLLGRCVLRLQQYERLIKAVVAHHEISGPVHDLASIQAARVADAATKTLGTLVRHFLGSYVETNETDPSFEATTNPPGDVASLRMKTHLSLSAEDFHRIESDLKELVALRNNLVHHFIGQHDLRSLDGTRSAHDALIEAYRNIDRHFERLRGWAEHLDQVRRLAAELMQSNVFHDLVVNGIAPDGTVVWPVAGIVCALREAAGALAVDGWTPVAMAGRWIAEKHPEQVPANYGCSSWRQVLHESRRFDLRYREVDGQRTAWFRAKVEPASTR